MLSLLSLLACKKDKHNELSTMARTTIDGTGGIIIDIEDGDVDFAEIKKTIVGTQYNFPFKVETIKQAWNLLSDNDIDVYQPTVVSGAGC